MRCSGGTGFVDTGWCIASISGQSMVANAAWDGTINVEEYVSRFGFGTGAEAGRLKVKDFVDSSAWEVKETMRRAYSDVMTGRTSIGGFVMPVDVSGSNS